MLLEPTNIWIHCSHVFGVYKDESFFWVESQSQNVFNVLVCQLSEFIEVSPLLMKVFLVISHLNHKWHIKCLLEVLIEDERQHVPQVKSL